MNGVGSIGMFAIGVVAHRQNTLGGGGEAEVGGEEVDGVAQKERAEECEESGTCLG